MKKKELKKLVMGLGVSAMLVAALGLTACSGSSDNGGDAAETPAAEEPAAADEGAASPDEAENTNFTEVTIENAAGEQLDGIEVGDPNKLMAVSGVYFQPVPMSDGTKAEDFDLHLEADVSALDNTLGFETGTWIPYLTVDYVISKDGAEVTKGTFMEMSASDGPHYGANIKLDEGTYDLQFIIHSPAENSYLLHTDADTGPGGSFEEYFGNGNLTVDFQGWEFQKQGW